MSSRRKILARSFPLIMMEMALPGLNVFLDLRRWRSDSRKKKARQKLKSISSHVPPLYASCPGCLKFLKWKPFRFDWQSCDDCFLPFCQQCRRIICVACTECDSVAERIESIDHWYCPHCICRDNVPVVRRIRRPPNRYAS